MGPGPTADRVSNTDARGAREVNPVLPEGSDGPQRQNVALEGSGEQIGHRELRDISDNREEVNL